MVTRMCSYCEVYYSDEEGPHPYSECLARLLHRREAMMQPLARIQENIDELRIKIAVENAETRLATGEIEGGDDTKADH